MKKIIGLIGRPDFTPSGKEAFIVYDSLRKLVSSFDCIPLGILPIDKEKEELDIDSFIKF